jgi:hypothetical protein
MNSFKDYLIEKHPDFKIKEGVLGALGAAGLGLLAVGKTAIERSRGEKVNYTVPPESDSDNGYRYNNNYYQGSRGYKTNFFVNNFINQSWDWDRIINDGIIKFGYIYNTGSETLQDNNFTPILKADRYLNSKASLRNKKTGKIVPLSAGKQWLISNAKNYWNDELINKFYKSLEMQGKTPEEYGGEDIR